MSGLVVDINGFEPLTFRTSSGALKTAKSSAISQQTALLFAAISYTYPTSLSTVQPGDLQQQEARAVRAGAVFLCRNHKAPVFKLNTGASPLYLI